MNRLLALIAALAVWVDAGASTRPNVVFLLSDDQGAWALGGQHPDARTPNLDRVRAGGAALSRCYSPTPVCSPARVSLLTSRYGTELGVTDYLLPGPGEKNGVRAGTPTWPALLAESGYATGLFGKFHCGNGPENHPTRIGYQEFAGFIHGPDSSVDPEVEVHGTSRRVEGWTEDIVTRHALEFIQRHRERPFAVSIHFWAPHANTRQSTPDGDRTWLPVSPEDWAPFADRILQLPTPVHARLEVPRATRMLREYLASVHSVDRNVGRVLALLDELSLADNTLLIFTSDHGFNVGHHGIWHKGNGRWLLTDNRGSRPNLWETSLRVPALVRWPRVVAPGAEFQQVVTHLDWFPTLLAAAGVTLPPDTRIFGRNLLPLLKGEPVKWPDELYAQYSMRGGPVMRSYQTDRWKLVRYLSGSQSDEFYDRLADPEELTNLASLADARAQDARRSLEALLQARMRVINDPALEQLSHRNESQAP